jgi:N-acetylmuramoyl-L-alanine amidase
MVVIHYTAMSSAGAALDRLCDPAAEVSAHYLICERGGLTQLVDEAARAWHAGAGGWGAVRDVNSRSIGIELANAGPAAGLPPFPAPQMAALERLLAALLARWGIPPERVIAHSDMAPLRKADPGPKFDWRRLALAGLSVWPAAGGTAGGGAAGGGTAGEAADWAAFRAASARFGYVWPEVAQAPALVLAAFRQRFRPWAAGPLDGWDVAAMQDLARRWPCAA